MSNSESKKFDWRKVLKRGKKAAKKPRPSPVKKAVEAVRENGRKLKTVVKRPLANWELFRTWVLIILAGAIIWQAVIGWGPAVNCTVYAAARASGRGVYRYAWQIPRDRYRAWQRSRSFKSAADKVEQETWLEVVAYRWDVDEIEYGARDGTQVKPSTKTARWAITANWAELEQLSAGEAEQQWAFGMAFLMSQSVCPKCLGADVAYFAQLAELMEAPRSGEMVYQWLYDMTIPAKAIGQFFAQGSIGQAAVSEFLKPYALERYQWFMMWQMFSGPMPFTGAGWTWH